MKKLLFILLICTLGCEKQEPECKLFVRDDSQMNVTRIVIQYQDGQHQELDRYAARNGGVWVDLLGETKYIEFEQLNEGRFEISGYEWPVHCGDSVMFNRNRIIDVR